MYKRSKMFLAQVVFRCQDCNHHVGTLRIRIPKPPNQVTANERFWLVHEVLVDAMHDGIISPEEVKKHNLGATVHPVK